ncbi:isopentenyl-diphosphate Delta-isomerase [Jiangella anatolica]|uniref:Isopentenyl-diphosphate Delta-isomerase n=1 Tax=Jiangella anatolica TaxID=2670374 RepID=A0A2W2BML3_9ACTN|nr:isopentenyl-diphosphate Delta-isomerase [Jiangella anatolica]PZF81564.1 isopentenyl-diphosphate delta-isomerase [Jiangella anatolica]
MTEILVGERVVLLDPAGAAVGTALKSEVHTARTPLHLAFSCYVFDAAGSLLVTKRAATKPTWPDVWTNSFCGHPGPGEDIAAAIARRGVDELAVRVAALRPVLPRFRYRAVMPNGVVENEVCPVFAATTADPPEPHDSEVGGFEWIPWTMFRDDVLTARREVSPWCAWQVAELASFPDDPLAWPAGDWAALPPAVLTVG